MKDDPGNGQGLKSLDAALGVLALMARYPAPQSLSTIARDAGMTPSKIHRYLASFVHAGLVKQEGRTGRYGIGPEALQLGVMAISQHDFVNDTAEGLGELVEATGMTALLSVWANEGGTVVRWERGATPTDSAVGLGTTLPLLNSATGHAFLAWAPERIVSATAAKQMRRAPKVSMGALNTPKTKSELRELTQSIRQTGYASVVGHFIPGLVAVAAPILDWQGEAQCVVTLVGIDPSATQRESDVPQRLVAYCRDKSFNGS